jgi:tetratricopeptide (TPR) repeat protein
MRTHISIAWWLGIGTVCLLSLSAVVNGQELPRIESLEQLTRIQIPVTSGSGFHLLSGKSGEVTLVVERVATGAMETLPKLADSRVKQVTVKTLGLDKAEVTVHFTDAATESFAYNQGSNLVLDLWKGAGAKAVVSTASAVKSLPQQVKKPGAAKIAKAAPARTVASAKPASARAPAAPAVDPLRVDHDLFQRFLFPMPPLEVTAKDGGIDLPPKFELDDRWSFAKGDKETDEGKGFEFAKQLFSAKKYGLCLKTIEIVLRDHPKTGHTAELEFLRALAYRRLGEASKADFLVDRSEKLLQELAARRDEEGKALPFARLIVLHFAADQLQKQAWLAAIQNLEYVSSVTKPKDPDFPYVQMMLAEAYGKVEQPRRSERLYRFLTEKFPKHPLAKEAAYRIADLLAAEKNYARVAEEGEDALHTYPQYEKTRSEVLFHVGEAYFWQGEYAKAAKYFRRYTEIASAQTNASLAWVRLGEIEEVAHRNISAARADYLKAKNGYPFSKGDLVATVRLARIDLPTEKDPKFVVRTLEELLADKAIDWDLRRMAELTFADYLLLTGETERSISLASAGMAQTDGSVYELYKHAYEKGLFTHLNQLVKAKKYGDALALYEREKKWLEEYGADTFKSVAEAYRGLGLYESSNKLMEKFALEAAKRGRSPSGLSEAKEQFSREKAENSFARGSYEEALASLAGFDDARSLYLRAICLYRLGRKSEAYPVADRVLGAMKSAPKGQFSDDEIENVGEALIERDNAERDFPRMEKNVNELRALCEKDNERLTFASADALWYQKRHKEAEKAYKDALARFPKGIRSDRARYNLGMSLLALGKREDAVKLMTELQNSGQSVWSDSAKQELELIEWERKYSSVLRTLPPSGLGIAN